jgi:hypothetical protein
LTPADLQTFQNLAEQVVAEVDDITSRYRRLLPDQPCEEITILERGALDWAEICEAGVSSIRPDQLRDSYLALQALIEYAKDVSLIFAEAGQDTLAEALAKDRSPTAG